MGNSTDFLLGIFAYIDNRLYWFKKYEKLFSMTGIFFIF
jgi:hypothetical protein